MDDVTNWGQDVLSSAEDWRNHRSFQDACDRSYGDIRLFTEFRDFTLDVPTVVAVIRNERVRLPAFLSHYRRLGVRTFHLIDNNSYDGTAEIAARDPSVTLWKAAGSFAAAAAGR